MLATYALAVLIGGRITGWLANVVLLGMCPSSPRPAKRASTWSSRRRSRSRSRPSTPGRARHARGARALLHRRGAVLAKVRPARRFPPSSSSTFLAVERDSGRSGICSAGRSSSPPWPSTSAGMRSPMRTAAGPFCICSSSREFRASRRRRELPPQRAKPYGRMVVSLLAGLLPWSIALAWCGLERLRGVRLDRPARFLHTWVDRRARRLRHARRRGKARGLPAPPAPAVALYHGSTPGRGRS